MESIGNFLRDNRWLRELYLAAVSSNLSPYSSTIPNFLLQNDFVGDSDVTASFAEALNSSSLKVLSLSSCDSLSDAFAERFFPRLSSPHLVNLQLSSIGLTRTAVPWIVGYLSSPRSRRLATLKLNGNGIGARGAAKIVRTVMDANFNVLALEMHGVQTYQGDQGDGSGEDSAPIDRLQQDLMYALTRNDLLQRQTQAAAVRLLQYSRTLLLDPRRGNEGTGRPQSHIQSLPAELRLHILSLTVNTLSTNQCIRIFQFASDPATLPAILPDLRQRQSEGIPERSLLEKSSAPFTLPARSANRTQWLQAVGCDLYEP